MSLVVNSRALPTQSDVWGLYASLNTPAPADIMTQFTAARMNTALLESYLKMFTNPSQQATIIAFFRKYGVNRAPVGDRLLESFKHGLFTGLSLAVAVGFITIPASIMMNANVHHHPSMRLLMGILGTLGWIFTLIYGLIFMRNRHYFGMFPMVSMPALGPAPTGTLGWLHYMFRSVGSLYQVFMNPFNVEEDSGAYKKFLTDHVLPQGATEFVPEELYEKARVAAATSNQDAWRSMMQQLEPVAVSSAPVQQ